jgi:hypothetical protein
MWGRVSDSEVRCGVGLVKVWYDVGYGRVSDSEVRYGVG